MMENAGRALAKQAMDMFASATDAVVVLAGAEETAVAACGPLATFTTEDSRSSSDWG